jgi:hypothetical protein
MAHQVPWPKLDDLRTGTRVEFDESTAATHQVAAGVTGAKWRVLHGWLQNLHASLQVNVQFTDASGVISSPFMIPPGSLIQFGVRECDFWQSDNAGEALSLIMDTAVNVKGDIYVEKWSE